MEERRLFAAKSSPRWVLLVFVGVGVVYILGCIDLINIHIDDALVTMRYSRNVLHGFGPVYNPGEAIEGYSCPTWMFLVTGIAAATGLTTHYELFCLFKALCVIFGLFTLVAIYRLARLRGNSLPAVAFLTLIVAASPFLNTYNVVGMETSLVTFLVTLTFLFYFLWDRSRALSYALGFGITLGLLSISRPEGILYPVAIFVGLFAMQIWNKDEKLPYLYVTLAVVCSILGAFTAFRFAYYGEFFPNTLYAKNNLTFGTLHGGLTYTSKFLAIAVAPYALAALLKKPPLLLRSYLPLYFVLVAQIAFATYAGGDFMPGFRLLVPILPLAYFVLVDQVDLSAFTTEKMAAAVGVAVFVAGSSTITQRGQIHDHYQKYVSGINLDIKPPKLGLDLHPTYEPDFYPIALKLNEITEPGETVLTAQAGLIPYLNDDLIFNDLYGLTDKHLSKDLKGAHGSRIDNAYFFAGNYDYVVYVVKKNQPDIDWGPNGGVRHTGMEPVDIFVNDPRFNDLYAPVYKGNRGAIFKRI